MDSVSTQDVLGMRLRVRDTGENGPHPPLLICNGSPANLEMLEALIDGLSARRRVIAFDYPGMGRSPAVYPTLGIPVLALVADRLATKLGVEQMDVLGYSFGGAVAQHLALTRGKRVRRLVLVAAVYGVGSLPPDPLSLLTAFTSTAPALPTPGPRLARGVFGGGVRRSETAMADFEERLWRAAPDPISYLGQAVAISTWSGVPWLRMMRRPTLVIAGGEDTLVPKSNATVLSTLIPNATLKVMPDAGHLMIMDQVDELSTHIEDFLDG